jgi:KDO transferase-3
MTRILPEFGMKQASEKTGEYDITWHRKPWIRTRPLTELCGLTKEAVIVTTGPSIKDLDPALLRGKFLVGVNGAFQLRRKEPLDFDLYVILDRKFARDRFEICKEVISSGTRCFVTPYSLHQMLVHDADFMKGRENLYMLQEVDRKYDAPMVSPDAFWAAGHLNKNWILPPREGYKSSHIGFSNDLCHGVFTGSTVAYVALQVCCYAGAHRIAILGMDLGNADQPRFYETKENCVSSLLAREYEPVILPSFILASAHFRKTGVKVYNLSPVSRLPDDILQKVSAAEFLGDNYHPY